MKKKLLILILTLVAVVALSLPALASAYDGLCGCGREFSRTETKEHMIYDCLGCGRNYSSCVCKTCWCGEGLTRTTLEDGTEILSCRGCGLPCEDCICRDRSYYDALQGVEQGLTGEEIPNPNNGAVIALATLLPFGGFLGLYFTVYRRRSSTRNRKDRIPALEKELDAIDREPDARRRYELAKNREEAKRDGDPRIVDREGKALCIRRNELLADVVEEDLIRETVAETLRNCAAVNKFGLCGSVETADRLWDSKTKDFSADREEIAGETPAEFLVKWATKDPSIALFEIVKPLNGREGNLNLRPLFITRVGNRIFGKKPLMNHKTDPATEEERRQTIARLVPGGDVERLLRLDEEPGESLTAPAGLPDEAPSRRIGEKNRFPGGITE